MIQSLSPTFDGKRTIPSPEVTRLMLELLNLSKEDKVLEIGTGSGRQTAELAKTGAEVHSIELEPWIDRVDAYGTSPIYLHAGDGAEGLPQEAPFSAIVASCGLEQIPQPWIEQLANEGRMVAPVGDARSQRLTLFRKQGLELIPQQVAAYVRFQMLRAKPKPKPMKPIYKTGGNAC